MEACGGLGLVPIDPQTPVVADELPGATADFAVLHPLALEIGLEGDLDDLAAPGARDFGKLEIGAIAATPAHRVTSAGKATTAANASS